jgi:hypothetical protein
MHRFKARSRQGGVKMPIPRPLESTVRLAFAVAAALSLPPAPAYGGSHTWDVNEVFSDATGQVQFVELVEANGTPNETGVPGHNMTSNAKSFAIVGAPLVAPTSNKFYLIATAAFAALPGAPTPDAIIPAGVLPFFFSTSGDTVTYVPWDALTFGSVPTDGTTSLNGDLSTGLNSPTNYAGVSGSVDASPAAVPLLSEQGFLVLGLLLAAIGTRALFGSRATS